MRLPRFRPRLSVASLMILVLGAGLACWGWVVPWLKIPTVAEPLARADYAQALLTREVAEYALTEYEEGVYKQDLETARAEIVISESDLTRARDRLEWQQRAGTASQREEAQRELDLARKSRDEQVPALKAIHDRQVTALRADIARARGDEAARKAILEKARFLAWLGRWRR